MAKYDLTLRITPHLDSHLVLPIFEFLQERQLYPEEQILKVKIKLLNKTNMVDYAMEIHQTLYNTEPVPQEMMDRRVEVVARLKALEEALLGFPQNEEKVQIAPEQMEALYQFAKFQFECGNYSGAADCLYHYSTNSKKNVISALWGKLAAEILMHNWDVARKELNHLKGEIDSKTFGSPLYQMQSRVWLMHWSLFVFFNLDEGSDLIIELFNQDKYLNAIQIKAPHLLRYLATAFIVSIKKRPLFKDFIKVIQQEQHSYKDPITEFLTCVFVNCDFDAAKTKLRECEEVILNDPFLGKRVEFLENARLLLCETYCKIHQRIEMGVLAEELDLSNEEAEDWIINFVNSSRLKANIDRKSGTSIVVMERPNYPNVYEQPESSSRRTDKLAISLIRQQPQLISS